MNKWKKNSKKFFLIFRDPRENYEVKRQQNGQTYFYGDKRQETRDKTWTGYSCCSFLWNFVCKALASFFFSWPHYLSLGLLVWELIGIFWVWEFTGKLIKAALFVWGAVKWRYYTLLPDIVIVISEQDNLRCTWLTELVTGVNRRNLVSSKFLFHLITCEELPN